MNELQNSLRHFSKKFKIDFDQLYDFIDYYNSNYAQYSNDIYTKIETRIAHWYNYQTEFWFNKRINILIGLLEYQNPDCVIDIGYSVPYYYQNQYLYDSKTKFAFIDKEESSIYFYNEFVDFNHFHDRLKTDFVIKADIDLLKDHVVITEKVCQIICESYLIVAIELVEHLNNPSNFWRLLNSISRSLKNKKCFCYITLPVGEKIPSHNLCFSSNEEVLSYLSSYIEVLFYNFISPPSEKLKSKYLQSCVCAFGFLK